MQKRTKVFIGVAALAAVLAGAVVWWFFIRDDAPAAVSLDDARASVEGSGGSTDGDLSGSWSVDPSIGDFDDFSGSFAGYRVDEELSTIGSTTAVGRTPDVSGDLTLEGTDASEVTVTVALTDLESDESFRDGAAQRALDVDEFPEAVFVATDPIDLGGEPADGATVVTDVGGELTLHGETLPVTAAIEAELADGVIIVTGTIDLDMTDFGITPPKAGPVVSISDQGQIEFQLFFTKSS